MARSLIYPQEIELHYILPALRREYTVCLKQMGLDQKSIASLLQVTEPAVSQYVSNKRAQLVKFTPKMRKEIHESARRLAQSKDIMGETQGILELSRKEGVTCDIHCRFAKIEAGCNACRL